MSMKCSALVTALLLLFPASYADEPRIEDADSAVGVTSTGSPEGALERFGPRRFGHGRRIDWLAFSADGKLLASASDDETACLWSVPDGRRLLRLDARRHVGSLSF